MFNNINKDFISFVKTDLAADIISLSEPPVRSYSFGSVMSVNIENEREAEYYGKPAGHYVTVSFRKLWTMDGDALDALSDTLMNELRKMASALSPDYKTVLIAGLGNQHMTADALGPMSVRKINVTRHLKQLEPDLFNSLGSSEISALAPGVVGQTGIETLELIRGAVGNVKPDILIVIDALASRSIDRLASTVQLTDTGITPGSGIGNHRKEISKKSVGVPTIAIGVPTVVSSSTLVYDALEKAGITNISEELRSILENGRNFFVTLKESDTALEELSSLIASAVNKAFSADF